jgi:hypothetical protein
MRWTFESELATVHPVAGQPRPVGPKMRLDSAGTMGYTSDIHIGDVIWLRKFRAGVIARGSG